MWHLPPNASCTLTFFRGSGSSMGSHSHGLWARLLTGSHLSNLTFTSHRHHLLSRAVARPASSRPKKKAAGTKNDSDQIPFGESSNQKRAGFNPALLILESHSCFGKPFLFWNGLAPIRRPLCLQGLRRFLDRPLSSTSAPCRDRQSRPA